MADEHQPTEEALEKHHAAHKFPTYRSEGIGSAIGNLPDGDKVFIITSEINLNGTPVYVNLAVGMEDVEDMLTAFRTTYDGGMGEE